jgi:sorting nexin-4
LTTVGVDDSGGGEQPDKRRHEVWRRYSEFEVLRLFLCAVYPHIVIPPLPEKAVSWLISALCTGL